MAAKDEQIASLKSQDEKQKAELAKNKEQIEDLNKSLLNAQSKLKEAVKLSLSVSAMNASTVNPAASAASSANEIKANVTNAPPSTAPKEIAEQIKSTFDKGVTTALGTCSSILLGPPRLFVKFFFVVIAAEGMNQMLDINRISNAIKKEVAIAFLKDLNSARKAGDETAVPPSFPFLPSLLPASSVCAFHFAYYLFIFISPLESLYVEPWHVANYGCRSCFALCFSLDGNERNEWHLPLFPLYRLPQQPQCRRHEQH